MADLERAAFATRTAYSALGNDSDWLAGGVLVTADDLSAVWEANLLAGPTAADAPAIAAMLLELAQRHANVERSSVVVGPDTPAALEAHLAAEDWQLDVELQLVLTGPLLTHPRPVTVRRAITAADWAAVQALFRADHEYQAERDGHLPDDPRVTRQIVDAKRAKGPGLAVWIASEDDEDVGLVSSWPGSGGLGMVADLFTLAAHRGRGVAVALLAQGVDDVRARGATTVLICARVDDTPKRAYRRMGFEPVRMARTWRTPVPGR